MTEPRGKQREPQAAAAVDPGLEVRPEVIKDLDVTGDDIPGDVRGGVSRTHYDPCQGTQPVT